MVSKRKNLSDEDVDRLLKLDEDIAFAKRFLLVLGKIAFCVGGGVYAVLSFITSTKEFWRTVLRDFLK